MPTATAVPTTTAEPRLCRRRNQYGANYAHHYERGQILESHGIAPAWERITPARLMDRQGGLFLSKSRFRHRSEAAVALQHDDTSFAGFADTVSPIATAAPHGLCGCRSLMTLVFPL